MVRVNRTFFPMRLLAWCFAALFLVAQNQASAHFHDISEDASNVTSCVVCVIGSQLDDAVDADVVSTALSASWQLPVPICEDQALQQFLVSANARSPPNS